MNKEMPGGRMKIGFLGAVTLIFVVLKLTGVVAWSWLWVWSPLLIPTGIIVCAGTMLGLLRIRKETFMACFAFVPLLIFIGCMLLMAYSTGWKLDPRPTLSQQIAKLEERIVYLESVAHSTEHHHPTKHNHPGMYADAVYDNQP